MIKMCKKRDLFNMGEFDYGFGHARKQNVNQNPENLCALQHLINHDILEAIQINLDAGNITVDDAIKLRSRD